MKAKQNETHKEALLEIDMTSKTETEDTMSELDAITASLNDLPDESVIEGENDELILSDNEDEVEELDVAALDEEEVEELDVAALDEEEVGDLELAIDKHASYAKQESVAVETVNPARDGSTVAKKSGSKKPSTPRIERSLTNVSAEFFMTAPKGTATTDADMEKIKASMMADRPKQVKIAEKYDNFIMARAAGKLPSKYIVTAFNALEASTVDPKKISMSDLIAAYIAEGMKDGTARSQAGQMMVLLPALGMTLRVGKEIEAIDDSTFAQFLRDFAKAP